MGECLVKVYKSRERETKEQGKSQECVRATTGNAALTKFCLVFFGGQRVAKDSLE